MKNFHSIFNQSIMFWLISFVVVLIPILPLFHAQFFRTHDFTHGARIVEMYRGFQDGQIPVRWSQNFGYGYGMPTFLFYGPLPYIVGAFVYWLTHDVVFAARLLWALPTIAGYWGMYRLMRKHTSRVGAFIAAAAFTLAPYRAVDLYVRGAVSEVWGIAFFPWMLLSVESWLKDKRFLSPQLISLTGLLLITHNLMAMLFLPVTALYGLLLVLFSQQKTIRKVFQFFSQLLIGVGLAAFFIVPALFEKGYTQIEERILTGYFKYVQHFLYVRQFFNENWKYGGSVWGPNDDISFFLGFGQYFLLAALCIGLGVWVFCQRIQLKKSIQNILQRQKKSLPLAITALITFPASLFFTLSHSEPIWKLIGIIQTVQFPWRFLSISIFSIAALGGFAFKLPAIRAKSVLIALIAVIILIVPALHYFQPENYLDTARAFYYPEPFLIRSKMSETWPDFLPKEFVIPKEAVHTRYELPDSAQEKDIELLVDRSHELALRTHFLTDTQLTLNLAYFPGWTAYINGKIVQSQVTPNGLMQLLIPSGDMVVSVRFNNTPIRTIADTISLICLGILLLTQIQFHPKKRYHEH